MHWVVHGERSLYESDWLRLQLVDVEVPGQRRYEHHVVRYPQPAAGVIVHDPERGILLLWRHRFITDAWGWEIPAGMVDAGETVEAAAAREAEEETGWRPGPLRPLLSFQPAAGIIDQTFHVFVAAGATYIGEPVDPGESERIEWVAVRDVRALLASGGVVDGMSVAGLATALATGTI